MVAIFMLISYQFNNQTMKDNPMKHIDPQLPTIGILIFEEFLTNEIVAPMDVFTKPDSNGRKLFNVIVIAKENKIYVSEEGLQILPDVTIDESPELDVLVVPSSNHPVQQIGDRALVNFIKKQNETADYIASHCAGAFILGESGVADNKKIVTYPSGAAGLKKAYPKLLVMDEQVVPVARDGNIISSSGNLVSYIASLDLLELMTNLAHRKYVEEILLINKLKG